MTGADTLCNNVTLVIMPTVAKRNWSDRGLWGAPKVGGAEGDEHTEAAAIAVAICWAPKGVKYAAALASKFELEPDVWNAGWPALGT